MDSKCTLYDKSFHSHNGIKMSHILVHLGVSCIYEIFPKFFFPLSHVHLESYRLCLVFLTKGGGGGGGLVHTF
jgi:hypothetical protein